MLTPQTALHTMLPGHMTIACLTLLSIGLAASKTFCEGYYSHQTILDLMTKLIEQFYKASIQFYCPKIQIKTVDLTAGLLL